MQKYFLLTDFSYIRELVNLICRVGTKYPLASTNLTATWIFLICCLLSYLQTLNKEISVSEQALLHIEKQALIQVMIHQIALQFDYRKPLLMHKVQ